ncbi:MAG: NAD-dependent epimerase/dehydratase family protein [Sulfuricaulis sp.]
MAMHILVTGGAGFIGSHLTDRLLAAGDRVRILDDLSTGKRENLPQHHALEFVEGDIRDAGVVERCMDGVEAVVHLAAVASVHASIDDPVHTHQVNFDGTLNLLEAARRHGTRRFLYACSAAIYGDAASIPVLEGSAPNPLSPYAVDKLTGEYYLLHYHRQFNLAATSFRFFNIYGPRQDPSSPYSGVISIFMNRLQQNRPVTVFGDGSQTRDFVYVADLAELIAQAVSGTKGAGEIFNIGTGTRHSLLQLLDHLETLSGKKIARHHEPSRLGDIQHSCADVTRLRRVFGIAPSTPFDQGLKKLLESLGS